MWWAWISLAALGALVGAALLVLRYTYRAHNAPPWNGTAPRASRPQARIARERLDDLNARRAALGKPPVEIRYVGDGAPTTDDDIQPGRRLNTDHGDR